MFQEHIFHLGDPRMRVELDKKSLFALASDTRLDILKSLQPMRRTVTQLSETLNIDKAAVFRHLKKMEDGGLVKRYEDHGFVYYGLSWKARDLLSPDENTRIVVLLSCTWLLVMGAVFLLVIGTTTHYDQVLPKSPETSGYRLIERYDPVWDVLTVWLAPAMALLAVAVILALDVYTTRKKPRQPSPPKEAGEWDLTAPARED
jgi:DNA-binding transcriptional ArsR family regulator